MNRPKIYRVVSLIHEFLDRADPLVTDEYPVVGSAAPAWN